MLGSGRKENSEGAFRQMRFGMRRQRWLCLFSTLAAAFVGGLGFWSDPSPRVTLPGVSSNNYPCARLSFSPDGRSLVTLHYSPERRTPRIVLRLWEVAAGRPQATLH